jgi:hypothetical protein
VAKGIENLLAASAKQKGQVNMNRQAAVLAGAPQIATS